MTTVFGKGSQGQIRFAEFVKFMEKIGFQLSSQTKSSAWLFRHKTPLSISFHENHGKRDRKLDSVKLLEMAGDLRTAYGWTIDTFAQDR